MELPI